MDVLSWLTYLLPISAAAFVLYTAWRWLPVFSDDRLPDCGDTAAKGRFTFAAKREKLTKSDAAAMLVITAIYAAVAFAGLGDTDAPDSFCEFQAEGEYVVIELPEETEIGYVQYYCGLHTGDYFMQFSTDGENYTDVCTMTQHYADLFKWITPEFTEGADRTAKYIRIIAGARLSLGELALYDADGAIIDASTLVYDAGCAPVFDEQELVPEAQTYMNSTYFDEIYHARTAYENIEGVYPYEITHPPLGKIIISLGIRIFGMNPFGWRFSGTLFGVLMLPILYIFLKMLFGGRTIPICCTVIFAFDFMHFVQTRIATIDTYSVFFILLMYLFMWRYVSGGRLSDLALSGVFFGLGAASKWTCIYAGGGLAVIWLIHWITRRREEKFWSKFIGNCLQCVVFFIIIPCAIYYVSYIPYGEARGMSGVKMLFTKDYADIVIDNQVYMWKYHSGLVATHPYSSRWYQWLCDARPILYYLVYFDDGTKSAFGAFMNPLLCWGGFFAVIGCGIVGVKDRDGKSIFIVIGYLAQLLPWVLVSRLTFAYHYFPSEIFLVLALGRMFDLSREHGLIYWRKSAYWFTGLSVGLFAMFYPVLTGIRVARWYTTYFTKWFPSWPF